MPRNHFDVPTVPEAIPKTVRLGAGATANDRFNDFEIGKFVKLVGESRYNLCAAGDPIEGQVVSLDPAPQNGFSIGGVAQSGKIFATADGVQATPGTGTIAVGDYVVCGTVVSKGTALTAYPRVTKATTQTAGATDFRWRVVSLFTAGTGAVGSTIVIERV